MNTDTTATSTYVLIPGAGGAAWYWHRVESLLRQRGHDVLAIDLPADDDSAGLGEYADLVVDAIGGRPNVVLVAQSLGGFTAPLVCDRVPVNLLVFVNAMIPAPGETAGDWWENSGHQTAMREHDSRDGRLAAAAPSDEEFDVATYFLHDVPEEVVAASQDHLRDQSGTPFGSPPPVSTWPDVPTRVVVGRDDRFFPAHFQVRLAEERLGITPDLIPGGHLVALSQPQGLVDRLEAYRMAVPFDA